MAKRIKSNLCNLLPYKREDVLTIQDVEQQVGWEITAPKLGFSDTNYKQFKSPFVSTLLFAYIFLAFIGFNGEPLYGNR